MWMNKYKHLQVSSWRKWPNGVPFKDLPQDDISKSLDYELVFVGKWEHNGMTIPLLSPLSLYAPWLFDRFGHDPFPTETEGMKTCLASFGGKFIKQTKQGIDTMSPATTTNI